MTRLRICYGGSFDPVHNGHLAVARAARDAFAAEVLMLPAGDPPHKDTTHADAEQRAAMLALALANVTDIALDRRELQRAGPSYTVDTLRELRSEWGPHAPIAWLIGADSLVQLQTWHRWRELFELAHLVVVPRPQVPIDTSSLREQAPEVLAHIQHRWLPIPALVDSAAGGLALLPLPELRMESSTELRLRIQNKQPWQDWVPPAVAAYIVRLNLYQTPAVILGVPTLSDSP